MTTLWGETNAKFSGRDWAILGRRLGLVPL